MFLKGPIHTWTSPSSSSATLIFIPPMHEKWCLSLFAHFSFFFPAFLQPWQICDFFFLRRLPFEGNEKRSFTKLFCAASVMTTFRKQQVTNVSSPALAESSRLLSLSHRPQRDALNIDVVFHISFSSASAQSPGIAIFLVGLIGRTRLHSRLLVSLGLWHGGVTMLSGVFCLRSSDS